MKTATIAVGAMLAVAACGDAGAPTFPATIAATTTTAPTTTAATTTSAPTSTAPATTTTVAVDPLTGGIEGVQVYSGLLNTHTDDDVDYDPKPPVGGMHAPQWLTCGPYAEEVDEEEAVHSLEHGAVWITYDAVAVGESGVAALTSLIVETFAGDDRIDWILLSPYPEMPAPVVASAWGRQLLLDSADDPRLVDFMLYFANGPQNPEPGAPC